MIKRDIYLNKLEKLIGNEFIKVLTGVRRSGKSYLLMAVKDMLLEKGVLSDNIVYLNFEHPDNRDKLTYDNLYEYLKSIIKSNNKVYFLFDEVQEIEDWQKLVNGLRVAFDSDIYITGSNARLLSGELATYLSGRYIQINVYPLSFKEFLTFKNADFSGNLLPFFREYREYGGFPSLPLVDDKVIKKDILSGIFDSILLKDVSLRNRIGDSNLLLKITEFLLDNIGQPVSVEKIKNVLATDKRIPNNSTIDQYVEALTNAYLFYKVHRYDIRGKERLKTLGKYYVADLGLRNNVLKRTNTNRGSQLENIVYLELLRRGYSVFVGKYNDKEIDFVTEKEGQIEYIQVALQIPEGSTRETDNLLHLPDNYKKRVIIETIPEDDEIKGVKIQHIIDFLLEND